MTNDTATEQQSTTSSSTGSNSRIEPILVLYGSQTGNSEHAAKEICDQMTTKLSPTELAKLTGYTTDSCNVIVQPILMQLDDFLELHHCQWTRIFIIVVSSYGVGQAPLGSHRFRELCDAWLVSNDLDGKKSSVLAGTHFAMCGLGDSKYTTFFRNPTRIHDGLISVGATRIGDLGKADASGTGSNEQISVIHRWMDNIWKELAITIVTNEPIVSNEQLQKMQKDTMILCRKINPDLQSDDDKKYFISSEQHQLLIVLIVAIIAIAAYNIFVQQRSV